MSNDTVYNETIIASASGKNSSAVSWPAILAGAAVTSVVSLVLLLLGSGLGLASLSPWSLRANPSPVAFTALAASWLVVMQWLSSGLGGYITGRLRNRWFDTQADELFFRDTAHGFLTWTVATIVTVLFLGSAASSMIGGGVQAGAKVAAGHMAAPETGPRGPGAKPVDGPLDYYVDGLLRGNVPAKAEQRAETKRILLRSIERNGLSATDRSYLTQQVAARSGISQAEAAARVDQAERDIKSDITDAKKAADKARKTAVTVALLTVLSMLVGAFVASIAGVIGGRHRDLP